MGLRRETWHQVRHCTSIEREQAHKKPGIGIETASKRATPDARERIPTAPQARPILPTTLPLFDHPPR
jgi:hypothetical protein